VSKKAIAIAIVLALVALSIGPGAAVSTVEAQGPTNWAIVIAGGINVGNNHARYWNDLSEMYEILIDTYDYAADDVFVLYADGNLPSAANCHDFGNTSSHYPTDIIDYAATAANLDTVTDLIAASGHPCDTLFVFTTDHGGGGGTLCLWGETISAATFAGYIDDVTQYNWRAFELEQCFSGAMVPSLSGPNTVIATACNATESSCGAGASLYYYDPFVYYFNAALKGAFPTPAGGGSVNADANTDGKVSLMEAFNYAEANDYCAESPQYDDNGDEVSHTGQMPIGGDGGLGSLIFLGDITTHNPVAEAGAYPIFEQTYYQGVDVTLDGSGSSDPDGDPLTYTWSWAGGSATGVNPTVSLPLGTTIITLVVNDGFLNSCPDSVAIDVVDTTPPDVDAGSDITVEQATLAGTEVVLSATVSDICDADPDVVWSHGPTEVFQLGPTEVTVTATDASGNVASDTIVVHVVDTTPPEMACLETTNPHGKKVPPAKVKDSQNKDGFYELSAEDICDPDPDIFVTDTGSGTVFGPFTSGTKIKYTEDPDAMPEMKKIGSDKGQAGAITWHIIGWAGALAMAVDASGNEGWMACD
jgi:hypothetical protein